MIWKVTPCISCIPTVCSAQPIQMTCKTQQVKSSCAAPQVKNVSEYAGEKTSAKVKGKRPAESDHHKSVGKKVKKDTRP